MRGRLLSSAADFVLCDAWNKLAEPEQLNTANNCYSYAVGQLESIIDFKSRAHAEATPQPGDASGIPKNILLLLHYRSLPFWIKLAERDGLRRLDVGPNDLLPELGPDERLVALSYNLKHKDYHWLRREKNGFWTHKADSGRPPSWFDFNRQLITDPRRADLKYEYPGFVFFAAPVEGIEVRMKKEWLKFFNSLDDAAYGNYQVLRHRLRDLSELVNDDYIVMSDYLKDLAAQGDDNELRKFWRHLREGSRLPNADGLMPLAQAHAPLGLAFHSITR
jgi:hypothetical protein